MGWPLPDLRLGREDELLVMALSSAALLLHGLGQLARFVADRGKADARSSHLSRTYPRSYRDMRRWRLRGLSAAATLLLGAALLLITLSGYERP